MIIYNIETGVVVGCVQLVKSNFTGFPYYLDGSYVYSFEDHVEIKTGDCVKVENLISGCCYSGVVGRVQSDHFIVGDTCIYLTGRNLFLSFYKPCSEVNKINVDEYFSLLLKYELILQQIKNCESLNCKGVLK